MAIEPQFNEPDSFVIGDTVKWKKNLPDYPPTGARTLTYQFGRSDETAVEVQATNNGDGTWLITISTTKTAEFLSGQYFYQAYITEDSERYTIAQGTIRAISNIAGEDNPETRTHARKVVDALEAVLEGRASQSQLSLSIAGQSITLLSPEELIRWRTIYKAEVQMEERAEKIRQGLGGRKIRTRFV